MRACTATLVVLLLGLTAAANAQRGAGSSATAQRSAPGTVPPAPDDVATVPADAQRLPNGLASKVLTPGTGTAKPLADDVVTVNYTGWTADGKVIDSTVSRGQSAMFPIGRVIAGWRECVQLMQVGETRRCWIPKELGYRGQA